MVRCDASCLDAHHADVCAKNAAVGAALTVVLSKLHRSVATSQSILSLRTCSILRTGARAPMQHACTDSYIVLMLVVHSKYYKNTVYNATYKATHTLYYTPRHVHVTAVSLALMRAHAISVTLNDSEGLSEPPLLYINKQSHME